MRSRGFIVGILAGWAVLAWTVPARAGDTVLLKGGPGAQVQNLVDDGRGADTVRTWHRGFGFGGYRGFGFGGYRGFGYGGYRGFGLGGFGGYRGFGYGGFYRPYYGFGLGGLGVGYGLGFGLGRFGMGYGYGGYYPGFGMGYGYGGFYPGFGMGIGYGGFFGPCAGASAAVYSLTIPAGTEPVPAEPPDGGTYPYDGGPQQPASQPEAAPAPSRVPPPTVPMEGRAVSLPKSSGKWSYPAYGETAKRSSSRDDRIVRVSGKR